MDTRRYKETSRRYSRFKNKRFMDRVFNANIFVAISGIFLTKNNPFLIELKCKQIQEIKNANNNRD